MGKFVSSFHELEVFQKAYALSLELHKLTLEFPSIEQYALANQIRRASKSICANIAEGYGKQGQSKLEFMRFLSMAIGSSDEMQVWLLYTKDLGYIDNKENMRLQNEYRSVSKMLQKLRSSISDN